MCIPADNPLMLHCIDVILKMSWYWSQESIDAAVFDRQQGLPRKLNSSWHDWTVLLSGLIGSDAAGKQLNADPEQMLCRTVTIHTTLLSVLAH